jgi:predicted dinucleotide-binding enzyme
MPKALDIWCVDINETITEVREWLEKCDVVFLCLTFEKTTDWLTAFHDELKDKVIFEQCSTKEWIRKDRSFEDLDIRSMHILFRPFSNTQS